MPQPHSTHVGAVSWEPHCSSPTMGVGKAVQELYPDLCASKYKLNARGTHTPTHGLAKQLFMAATARGDMAVRMRKVLARPLGSVCVSLALYLSSR